MDIKTLSKANFYIFVPIFVFTNLYTHSPRGAEGGPVCCIGFGFKPADRYCHFQDCRARYGKKYAFLNSIMFYNSGNVGLP